MKKTSKLLAFFLAAVMAFSALPVFASADTKVPSGTCGTGVTWKVENDVLTISGKGAVRDYSETVTPDYSSKDIKFTSIVVEEGITELGDYAFTDISAFLGKLLSGESTSGLLAVKSLSLPSTLTKLGDSSIDGLFALETITVSDKNTAFSVKDGVLFNKNQTKLIKYPSGKQGREYTTPDSVTTIGNSAFMFTTLLKNVKLSKNVTVVEAEGIVSTGKLNVYVYNKNAKLKNDSITILEGKLYGYFGSTAQKYAEKNYIKFMHIGNSHKYAYTVTKKATFKKDGTLKNKCICGKVKKTVKIKRIKTVKLKYTSTSYTGKAKKPSLTIKDSKGKKIAKKYYTVKYKNNKKRGKATVTVKFKGKYSGTKKLTFKIK